MTKEEAVKEFVDRDFSGVPQDWIQTILKSDGEYKSLPMWGTMWIVNESFVGKKLMDSAIQMLEYDEDEPDKEHVNEEMVGELNVQRLGGGDTAVYIYEVRDEYVIGVDGAGWSFYDGVWDMLYDLLELKWHDES